MNLKRLEKESMLAEIAAMKAEALHILDLRVEEFRREVLESSDDELLDVDMRLTKLIEDGCEVFISKLGPNVGYPEAQVCISMGGQMTEVGRTSRMWREPGTGERKILVVIWPAKPGSY